MAKLKTRDWKAIENRQPPLDQKAVPFWVAGKVETRRGNIKPILREADAPSINPKLLILNLTLEDTGGGGTDDVAFRDVRYDKKVALGRFEQVEIRAGDENIATITVEIVQ